MESGGPLSRSVPRRDGRGGWRAALFIVVVGFLERIGFYGVGGNLITYLTGPLGMSTAAAAAGVNTWSGTVLVLPLVGALAADSRLGRYRAVLLAGVLYLLKGITLDLKPRSLWTTQQSKVTWWMYGSFSATRFKANVKAACYKNKEVKNWEAICTIYSKDHATGEGAMTGAESEAQPTEPDVVAVEDPPELPQKRQRTGDAILCMLGDMKGSFQDALKSLEPLELPKVTPPLEIIAALEKIPDLARSDMLRAYGKLILSERLFQALMELPMEFRKEWLLMLNEKNSV